MRVGGRENVQWRRQEEGDRGAVEHKQEMCSECRSIVGVLPTVRCVDVQQETGSFSRRGEGIQEKAFEDLLEVGVEA